MWLVGATQSLPGGGGGEKLHGNPTNEATPKIKNGKKNAKDGAEKRLECKTAEKETRKILHQYLVASKRWYGPRMQWNKLPEDS